MSARNEGGAGAVPAPRHERWAHLPAMPWRFVGMSVEHYQACQGAPLQVGGSCDHCATGIVNTYRFECVATGERFKVGSTCVLKMLKEIGRSNSLSAAKRAINEAKRERAAERRAAKAEALRAEQEVEARTLLAACPATTAWLAERSPAFIVNRPLGVLARCALETAREQAMAIPHPLDWRAQQGDTLADWAEWMIDNAGNAGMQTVVTELRAVAS